MSRQNITCVLWHGMKCESVKNDKGNMGQIKGWEEESTIDATHDQPQRSLNSEVVLILTRHSTQCPIGGLNSEAALVV